MRKPARKRREVFYNLMDQFFTTGAGGETRVVIVQLSGNDRAVLFEGTPNELRTKFRSPKELNAFLTSQADGSSSHVYHATSQTLNYVASIPGITENTRTLTALLSDMEDNELNSATRSRNARVLLTSLKRYQQLGGGLALSYVADSEISRWQSAFSNAGFEPGTYIIENNIVETPPASTLRLKNQHTVTISDGRWIAFFRPHRRTQWGRSYICLRPILTKTLCSSGFPGELGASSPSSRTAF